MRSFVGASSPDESGHYERVRRVLRLAADFFTQGVAADLAIQRGPFDSQDAGRFALMPARMLQRGQDMVAFDIG